jgi:hypothetical protein
MVMRGTNVIIPAVRDARFPKSHDSACARSRPDYERKPLIGRIFTASCRNRGTLEEEFTRGSAAIGSMRDRRFVMTRFIRITVGMFVFGWISPSAWAGPDWEEICDAGSSVGFAQPVSGGGSSVRSIRGRLGACPVAGSEGPDLEDVFLIFIDDPSQFCAKTVPKGESALCCSVCPPDCDSAIQGSNFNTQLWLFKADGTGLLGNDDELGGMFFFLK